MIQAAPRPCDTASCCRRATVTIEGRGVLVGRFCGECFAIIDLILDETSRMARTGVPRDVAAEWASRAVREIA